MLVLVIVSSKNTLTSCIKVRHAGLNALRRDSVMIDICEKEFKKMKKMKQMKMEMEGEEEEKVRVGINYNLLLFTFYYLKPQGGSNLKRGAQKI